MPFLCPGQKVKEKIKKRKKKRIKTKRKKRDAGVVLNRKSFKH